MDVYHLKVSLQGVSKPVVWRRIRIPGPASFATLHEAIQGAMGWEDCHLYEFSDLREPWDYDYKWRIVDRNLWAGDEDSLRDAMDIYEVPLDQVLKAEGDKIMYTYDMGDSWRHTVLLEKICPDSNPVIACTGGRGACPPEDVGGIGGYEGMKKIFRDNPRGEEAKSYKRWLGLRPLDEFDPLYFSQGEANDRIREYFEYPVCL